MKKLVVITGASSGLGLSHAIYLTHKGYTVFGTTRDLEKINFEMLKEIYSQDHTKWKFTDKTKLKVEAKKSIIPKKIANNLEEIIKKIRFFQMDVNSDISVNNAFEEMQKTAKDLGFDGIDVLINNAGISYFGSVEDLSIDDWKNTFETNFFGVLRTIKAVLPSMKERRKGQILNTSSLGGLVAIPFQTHYSASKSAQKLLTEGLRMELKEFNIKVSSILPSDINTNFNRNTLGLTKERANKLASFEIGEILATLPVDQKSDYFNSSKKVWKVIIQNLIISPPPKAISKQINRILKKRYPKVNYSFGDPLQRFLLLFVARRLFPDRWIYFILPFYYGM